MKITIVAVGKLKENFLRDGVAEYLRRITPFARVEIRETPEENSPEIKKALAREGERLLSLTPKGSEIFSLDLHGEELTSEEFAAKIAALALSGRSHLSFLIGGSFGISDEVRNASYPVSLSKMTLTHQMTRLFLIEQIYRAFKINRGEKYHW